MSNDVAREMSAAGAAAASSSSSAHGSGLGSQQRPRPVTIEPGVVKSLAAGALLYAKKLATDLQMFANHAGRHQISVDDCKLAARHLPVSEYRRAWARVSAASRKSASSVDRSR